MDNIEAGILEAMDPGALEILVVNAQESERRLIMEHLETLGHRVQAACDGREGFEKARYSRPDLIIMDVRMPNCDGIAACRLLNADAETRHIPVIFLSDAAFFKEEIRMLSEGIIDFVAKPLSLDELSMRVWIHLRFSQRLAAQATLGLAARDESDCIDAATFRAARKILLTNLAQQPLLAELGRAVGSSSRRLNEIFYKYAGKPVFSFVHEARMLEAARRIEHTNLEISTIARDLGYGNAGNFSTAFRHRFGVAPRVYRKSRQVK